MSDWKAHHNMSDWKAHHSLTLKDNEGHTVNAGRHVVADSDSVSRVRCNVSNSARSRSPAVVKVTFLFQPPAPPVSRPWTWTRRDIPSLPKPVFPPWVAKGSWVEALPFLSRTPKPPPPPSESFDASTCSARPEVMNKRSVHAKQERPSDRWKKVHREEKSGIAVAHHWSKERSLQPLTDKKALWQKRQLAQPKADSRTVAAPALKRRKVDGFTTATAVPVLKGARAHRSQRKASSPMPVAIGTTDSEVSASQSASFCVSEASEPSVSPPFLAGVSEGSLDSLNAGSNSSPKCCPNCRRTQCPQKFKHDFWSQVQTAYTVPSEGGRKLQFNDEVKGWAGIPQSVTFMDGFDTSQVSVITTKDAFHDSAHQSLSCTLFSSTPQSARRECLVAIERGLASKSLTVYFWKTKNRPHEQAAGHSMQPLSIRCAREVDKDVEFGRY